MKSHPPGIYGLISSRKMVPRYPSGGLRLGHWAGCGVAMKLHAIRANRTALAIDSHWAPKAPAGPAMAHSGAEGARRESRLVQYW